MSAPEIRRDLAGLLRDLVRIPSPSGEEEACAAFAAEVLAAGGLDVQQVGANVLASHVGDEPGPHVFLNSHLDTVPTAEGWRADPWDVAWEPDPGGGPAASERLTGLGANDAKASAASMMAALLDRARASGRAGRVTLALTACEETNNSGMGAILERVDLGTVDAAVTGEPTGLEVVRAQSGLCVLEATWRGRACHAAHVERVEHVNALALAARDLAAFGGHRVLEGEHPLLGPSTLAATVLHAGQRHNVVPDLAEAVLDGRLAPGHDAAECLRLAASRMPAAEVRVRSDRLGPVETPADHPLVAAALEAAGRSAAVGSSTMSDMALLAGVPAVKCGPGETARSHTPNEYVTRAELEAGARFYATLVEILPARLAAASEASA